MYVALLSDIPSWLQELGYDVNSLIPSVDFNGHINAAQRHSRRRSSSSSSSSSSRDGSSVNALMPVVSAFECAFNRDINAVTTVSTVPKSKITLSQPELSIKSFEAIPALLGRDVVLTSLDGGKVEVSFLENPDEQLALLAATVLNNSRLVDVQFTVHGRDVHYFVKENLQDAINDAKTLSLTLDATVIGNVNVTLHRIDDDDDGDAAAAGAGRAPLVDVRLHGEHSVFNVRYGTSAPLERERVLRHAMERAVDAAWLIERELAQSNKQSMYAWTQQQQQQLISTGRVANVRTAFYRDVSKYPQLADDPRNIRFIPIR